MRSFAKPDSYKFFVYQLAERLGQTVQKIMTGEDGPMSTAEMIGWMAYTQVHNAKEKAEIEKAKKQRG